MMRYSMFLSVKSLVVKGKLSSLKVNFSTELDSSVSTVKVHLTTRNSCSFIIAYRYIFYIY